MKVVLFCGGLGMRMRDYSDAIPKPMVTIGSRPALWHVMKYYAHFGHKEFILCLGYKGESIKEYFHHVMDDKEIQDWTITLVDTGVSATIGERLKAVQQYLDGERVFLANYSDGLTDLALPRYVDFFLAQDRVAAFLCVKTPQMFHVVEMQDDGVVSGVVPIRDSEVWINGGFFVFRDEIFRYLREGEDLVAEPFRRLIAARQLLAYKYTGFWAAMDTFKDRQTLDAMHRSGAAPWQVWRTNRTVGVPKADVAR
jgi:glucose-1-phosphate cytidylyltransferase